MGTVTQYNLANIRDALGGSNPVSMSQYYRGGARVPTTRTTTTTEGPFFDNANYYWYRRTTGNNQLRWAGVTVVNGTYGDVGSISAGGYLYIRGAFQSGTGSGLNPFKYAISRQYTTTTNINTGVPSSGTISISQLLGAENP